MAKRGGSSHTKRIAVPKVVPINNKKESVFILTPSPGPHPKKECVPLGVVIRDELKFAKTLKEVKKIVSARKVKVDGRTITDIHFPVGFMDVVSFDDIEKFYRIVVNKKGQLVPKEISKEEAKFKIGKVVRKHVVKGNKINITLHDGRNLIADNNIKVGDSIKLEIPSQKIEKLIPFGKGKCVVMKGKHAGTVAEVVEIIKREGRSEEVKLKNGGDFITVADYVFMIDDSYQGV